MSDPTDLRALARGLLAGRTGGAAGAAPAGPPAPLGPAAPAVAAAPTAPATPAGRRTPATPGARRTSVLDEHPAIVAAVETRDYMEAALGEHGMPNPYHVPHHGVNGPRAEMFEGERRAEFLNFSSYNYLGLAGDPRVQGAALAAVETYGTSCSASRAVSGQIPLHRELEERLAGAYGVDDAVLTGSGFLTNAAVIGFLLGPGDLAVCDALDHSSIIAGTQWAGCQRLNFRHNDPASLEEVLARSRGHFERAMVIVEGVYSMDGDVVALPEILEVARRHDCLVMVDEAHSFGVLGERGFGVSEHHGLDARDVDVWMGTLSKSMASYGGFVAGSTGLCEAMRMVAPGVSMYAAAPPPATTAAALAAFDVMVAEPWRVARLRENAALLGDRMRGAGLDPGLAQGTCVVPAMIGDSRATMVAAQVLLASGINAGPILYPAVPEGEARIRFFVTAEHTAEQVAQVVATLADHLRPPG